MIWEFFVLRDSLERKMAALELIPEDLNFKFTLERITRES